MPDLRIVCDTNVYISAALRGARAEAILRLAAANAVQLVVSPAILEELNQKLRLKFGWTQQQARLFVDAVRDIAEVVRPVVELAVVDDDPDDNRVIECAVSGEAALIVTFDRHLLRLKSFENVAIIRSEDLLHFGLGSDD